MRLGNAAIFSYSKGLGMMCFACYGHLPARSRKIAHPATARSQNHAITGHMQSSPSPFPVVTKTCARDGFCGMDVCLAVPRNKRLSNGFWVPTLQVSEQHGRDFLSQLLSPVKPVVLRRTERVPDCDERLEATMAGFTKKKWYHIKWFQDADVPRRTEG